MASQFDKTVAISCGGGADLALTRSNDLIATQEYSPGLSCRVNFGRMTKKRIDDLIDNLTRLKVHAVE